MIHTLKGVLTTAELGHLRMLADRANFVDGRVTNPHSTVKHNLQVAQNDPTSSEPGLLLRDALFRHPDIRTYAMPRTMARPTLSRYEPGMNYGWHFDEALLPAQPPVRSDISCTVFLSDPSSYKGGELSIQLGQQIASFKLPAGDAVLYPSTTIHQVTPVTEGIRLVGITWIQSFIPDPFKRDLLIQAEEANTIELTRPGGSNPRQAVLLGSLRTNLFRLWADA